MTDTTNATKKGTTVDKNGIEYVQPLLSDGFRLEYTNETWTFHKNFRTDGSMRCDFEDLVRNSVFLAGYFNVTGSDANEEVSAKTNGGPHSHKAPTYADTMDLGIINFEGTKSRVRWEKTHPTYSASIFPTSHQLLIDYIRNKWMGFVGLKINLGIDGDNKPDNVAIIGMVDVGGLTKEECKPLNQWKITF